MQVSICLRKVTIRKDKIRIKRKCRQEVGLQCTSMKQQGKRVVASVTGRRRKNEILSESPGRPGRQRINTQVRTSLGRRHQTKQLGSSRRCRKIKREIYGILTRFDIRYRGGRHSGDREKLVFWVVRAIYTGPRGIGGTTLRGTLSEVLLVDCVIVA